jgi:excisionase family DNA binding protein
MKNKFTVKQSAEYLGVKRQKIHQLIIDGELHPDKNPMDKRAKLIDKSELDRLKEYLTLTHIKPVEDTKLPQVEPVKVVPESLPVPAAPHRPRGWFNQRYKDMATKLDTEFGWGYGRIVTRMKQLPNLEGMSYEELRKVVAEKFNKEI